MRKIKEIEIGHTGGHSRYIIVPKKWVRKNFPTDKLAEAEVYIDGKDLVIRPISEGQSW